MASDRLRRTEAMNEVIFDSSFLISIAEEPTAWSDDMVTALGGFQPILLESVRRELERLSSRGGRRARSAKVAMGISKGFEPRAGGKGKTDDEIVSAALGTKATVATMDVELIRELRQLHVRVVTLRSGRVEVF